MTALACGGGHAQSGTPSVADGAAPADAGTVRDEAGAGDARPRGGMDPDGANGSLPADARVGMDGDGAVAGLAVDAGADLAAGEVRVAFVTSEAHPAALGGLAGADAICARLARTAGLAGEFRAWLSAAGQSPATRWPPFEGAYVRPDGVRIAGSWADLTDGALLAPLAVDERGRARVTDVWTGTGADGRAAQGEDCAGFTSAEPQMTGLCGAAAATDARWTANVNPTCPTPLALYCFQVR